MKESTTKIRKVGNSYIVTIPPEILWDSSFPVNMINEELKIKIEGRRVTLQNKEESETTTERIMNNLERMKQ